MSTRVPLNKVKPNPYQPEGRLKVDAATGEKFGRSILEHGLIMTPVARKEVGTREVDTLFSKKESVPRDTGFYQMGDGWLRFSGFQYLVALSSEEYLKLRKEIQKRLKDSGTEREVPAQDYFKEIPLDIRELTDQQMADMVLEANEVRQDMSPIDKARFYKKYLEDFPNITQAQFAAAHNITQGEVANTIRLLELPAEIQEKVISQEISETHGRQLLRLNYSPELQKEKLQQTIKNGYTIDQLSNDIARDMYYKSRNMETTNNSGNRPLFDTTQCESCEYRKKIGEPYSNNVKVWRCLNDKCWDKKQSEAEEKRQAELVAQNQGDSTNGTKILTSKDVSYNQKEDLSESALKSLDNPEECATCAKTALYKYSLDHSGTPERICLNPTCFRTKKTKKTRDTHAREKKQDQALTEKIGEEIGSLAGPNAVRSCLLVMARELLSELTNQEAKADILQFFPNLPTVKGKLDVEASKKVLQKDKWSTEHLMILCDMAIITRQRRQYSGAISPRLTGKVKQDYAMLIGKMDDYLKEIKAFEDANCKGCGHVKAELLGTGEDCCQATYYRHLDETGKCTGRTINQFAPEDNDEDKAAADLGEDECSFDCAKCGKKDCEAYGLDQDWKCKICGCTDDMGCQTEEGTCHWVEPNLCSACQGKAVAIITAGSKAERSTSIPERVRLCQDVPQAECHDCKFATHDHTVNFSFPTKDGAYQKVCLKDYRKFSKEEEASEITDKEKFPALFGDQGQPSNTTIDFRDLTTKISQKKGEPNILTCSGKKGEGEDLKEATIALCRELGIKFDSPFSLIVSLKEFPQSANRDLLLNFIEPVKVASK